MNRFTYPAAFMPDETDGGFVVTFRDVPEAITQGDSIEECIKEGSGALDAALCARIQDFLDIPVPSKPKNDEVMVSVPILTVIKASFYLLLNYKPLLFASNNKYAPAT